MEQEQVERLIFGTVLMGIGYFAGVPVVEGLIGGVAGNALYDIALDGKDYIADSDAATKLRRRLFGPQGFAQNDLRALLGQSFDLAIEDFDARYPHDSHGFIGDAQRKALFDALKNDARGYLAGPLPSDATAMDSAIAPQRWGELTEAERYRSAFERYAEARAIPATLRDPIRQALPELVEKHFLSLLAQDRAANNRAFRLFQLIQFERLITRNAATQALLAQRLDALQRSDDQQRLYFDRPAFEERIARLEDVIRRGIDELRADHALQFEQLNRIEQRLSQPHPRPAGPPKPPPPPTLFGRADFLNELAETLLTGQSVALWGKAGVGKSALALALANRPEIVDRFEGGRLWLPIGPHPASRSAPLLEAIERLTGTPPEPLSEESLRQQLQMLLTDKRLLLIVDDLWQFNNVALLLKALTPSTALLTTTRTQQTLDDVDAVVARLRRYDVRGLNRGAALELLRHSGPHTPAAVDGAPEAAAALTQAVGHLPLALRLLGRQLQRLARHEATTAIRQLQDKFDELLSFDSPEARLGIDDATPSLEAVLRLSYDELPHDELRRAFRRLAVFGSQPLHFSTEAMASVWQVEGAKALAWRQELEDAALLEAARDEREQIVETRYALHQVIGQLAALLLSENENEAWAARLAHAEFFEAVATTADGAIIGRDLRGLLILDQEIEQLRRAIAWLITEHGDAVCAALLISTVRALRNYALAARHLHTEYEPWLASALGASQQVGSSLGEANVRHAIGDILAFRDDHEAALQSYQQALTLFQQVGDRLGEANVRHAIGDILAFRNDNQAALASYQQALTLFQQVGFSLGEAYVRKAIGDILTFRKDNQAALASYQQALALFQQVGDRLGEANVLAAQSRILIFEQPEQSQVLMERVLDLRRQIGDIYSEGADLGNYAIALLRHGDPKAALIYLTRARDLFADRPGLEAQAAQTDQLIGHAQQLLQATSAPSMSSEEAESLLLAAIDELRASDDKPRLIQAVTALFAMYHQRDAWPEVADTARQLIDLGVEDGELWHSLGIAESSQGRNTEASAAFARAITLDENNAMLRRNYADTLLDLNELDAAEAQLDAAEALEADAPYLALHRARLAKLRGDRAETLRWANEALRRSPGWDEAEAIRDWAG
ncbi:MAG: tetratricopeptide repeat protein [Ardenticatenales bacterium]|nr:tetratricopeptide repeat protein [Ardenticatenales bacterium]